MASQLQREIRKQQPFDLPEEEAYLNVLRTHDVLMGQAAALFKEHGLSSSSYNVLRILRGVGGQGIPNKEIRDQMVARVPDVTRLVDRLELAGLVRRQRITSDRRVVLVQITDAGQSLLAALDEPVWKLHKRNLGHMSERELKQLSALLEKARCPAGEAE